MEIPPNDDTISRHSAPPVSVNLGMYLYYMEMRAPFFYVLSLYATIRSVMHLPLSDFGTHLRKCVRKTNMSSKAQPNPPMHLIPSVRRQNGPGLLGHLLRFCQHRPDKVGIVESSGILRKRPVPPELRPATQHLEIGPGRFAQAVKPPRCPSSLNVPVQPSQEPAHTRPLLIDARLQFDR